MLKAVAPLDQQLRRMLPARARPQAFRAHGGDHGEELTTGQRLAEQIAGAVGSWAFIGCQATVMLAWAIFNTLVIFHALHFDEYPFVFLNLAMSAEAAFTGPVLLIAANVAAMRDHAQAQRMEGLEERISQRLDELAGLVISAHSGEPTTAMGTGTTATSSDSAAAPPHPTPHRR